MKAHLVHEPRALLLWGFGPQSNGYAAVCRLAQTYRMMVRMVGNAELSATVDDLCAGNPAPDFAVLPSLPPTATAIIGGLSTEELNAFVDALKKTGAEFPVRAAVTPTSKHWTLAQLLLELNAEHTALSSASADSADAQEAPQ